MMTDSINHMFIPLDSMEAPPWEPMVVEWLAMTASVLRGDLKKGDRGTVGRTWMLLVGGRETGWSFVPCLALDRVPQADRVRVFADIISRTQATSLVYMTDGMGVWPETEEAWGELYSWREEHGGEVDEHPSAVRAVIALAWTADGLINLAVPFGPDGLPGEDILVLRSLMGSAYNEVISECAADPVGDC